MDILSLKWLGKIDSSTRKTARENKLLNSTQQLGIYVNHERLDEWLEDMAKKQGTTGLGDEFLCEEHVLEFAKRQWLTSCDENGCITLLACSCGHWMCSTITVKSIISEDGVHWTFDLSPVYHNRFGDLPEFWFDRDAYKNVISHFKF